MRASRMWTSLVVISLAVACQDAQTPTELSGAGEPQFSQGNGNRDKDKHKDKGERGGEARFTVRFERLVGNNVTGAAGQIRGQNAAGAPWKVAGGEASLSRRGELRVRVRGLVLQSTGVNPVPAFKAILSCLTPNAGTLATVNISTATVPVTSNGNADIREVLTGIPSPCYAPIVFVTSAGGSWFATTGG